jgi:hypothetical protein
MRKPRSYSVKEVFDSAQLGFTFEFYCSKKSDFIVEDLKKIVGKNVVLTDSEGMNPTYTSAILLKEYDGKRPRYQFKVGYQNYSEVPTFLNTILFWINESASLHHSTLLKTKLLFNFNELKTLHSISNMDVGKLVLKMNESYIYDRFPEMKKNPFALSIKKLVPYNMTVSASEVVNMRNNFKFPIADYYGVDLTEQTRGELTFNYIGGSDYSEKPNEIREILEYYIITTYQTLNSDKYTPTEVAELNKLTEEYRTFRKCYYDPERFQNVYKDFQIYIDLNKGPAVVEAQWFQIRDVISRLILESDVKKCKFNWDTEQGTFQIKDSLIESSIIKNIQIVNSTISGIVEDCHLWTSKIENSRIINSTLVNRNEISESYLSKVRADKSNHINESFIVNFGEIINCDVNNSVIKNAGIGESAKLDENSLVVNPKERNQFPSENGINVKEVRDYTWIKSLRDPDYKDKGFGNEYKDE